MFISCSYKKIIIHTMNINLIKKRDDIPQTNYRSNNKLLTNKRNDLHLRRRKEESSISTFIKKNITNVKHTKDRHVFNNKTTKTKFPEDKINNYMRKPNIINVHRKKCSVDIMNKGNSSSSSSFSFQDRRNNINDIKKDIGIDQSNNIKNDKVTCIKHNINLKELINLNLFEETKLINHDQKENLSHMIKEGDNKVRNVKKQTNKYNNVDNNKNNYYAETIYIVDEQEKEADCFPNNKSNIVLSYSNQKKEENVLKNNYKKNESLNINHNKRDDTNVCPVIKGLTSKKKNNYINNDSNIYKEINNNSQHIHSNIKTSNICKEEKTYIISYINNKSNIIFNSNINGNKNILNNVNTYKNKQGDKISNINKNEIKKNKKINDTSFQCIKNNINNTSIEEGRHIIRSNKNNNTFDQEINNEIHNKKDNYYYKGDTSIYYKMIGNQYNCGDNISININKNKETLNQTQGKLINTLDPTMNTTYKNNDKNVLKINHKEVRKGLTFEQMRRKSYEPILYNEVNINQHINENVNNIKDYNNNINDIYNNTSEHTHNNNYSDKKKTSVQKTSRNPIYEIKNKMIKRSTVNPKLTQKSTSKNSMDSFLLFPKKNITTNNFSHHINNDIKSASRSNILVKNKQIEKKKNNAIYNIAQNNHNMNHMDEKKKKRIISS